MSSIVKQPDSSDQHLLQEVIGYLNFSSGTSDPAFLGKLNALGCRIERHAVGQSDLVAVLADWLTRRMDQLEGEAGAFDDVHQARAVVQLLHAHLLPAYRKFHRDLLWHQPDEQLWRPLFLGRAFEALLSQGGPWNETDRIVNGALQELNDYLGYRPVAVLESDERIEPYAYERVRPIPLFIREVGVGCGPYEPLITRALEILAQTDPEIREQAWIDPDLLDELALDPRAYDFDHPAAKRPNYHFGQWDMHQIDNRGNYRRFVLQQITLDALLSRVTGFDPTLNMTGKSGPLLAASTRDELLFEAAAVLAGTILMASGTTGNGPACHSSDVTLATLLPHIAAYRDQFYEQLLARTSGPHGERLRAEAARMRQPFGGARQHLNHELARRRATQMQQVHLAQLYARMGYPDAALAQAHTVRIASARMLCQIYCRLTAGHHAIDARQIDAVAKYLPEIEELLQRGIECGALVDPWSILGFGGNFSLFPAVENSVHDFRVDDLVELVEQILDLCARAWTEAAAIDDHRHELVYSDALARLAAWWDKYATASVSGIKRLVAKETEVSTNLVAGALSAWHKAGAAAGDVKFWRMFVDQFDSPKAFQLVVEALLDRGDQVASMALMMQWLSQAERTPLEDGDASFHPLALRWLRVVEELQSAAGEDQWPLVAKFFTYLEANAETYWHVPDFELGADRGAASAGNGSADEASPDEDDATDDAESWSEDDNGGLYGAAYEDMVYRDSTDDGQDSSLLDQLGAGTDFELEEEAQRLARRLAFLATSARLWKNAAVAWACTADDMHQRRELFDSWRQQAAAHYYSLLKLVQAIHRFPVPPPTGSHDSNVEFDRRRMIKDSLLEQVVVTAVETADAMRLLSAASGQARSEPAGSHARDTWATFDVLRAVLAGDSRAVRRHWPEFTAWLAQQHLLYVPLAKGGKPRRIVRARTLVQLIQDLLEWLPRLGLVRETCQLLQIAQQMEVEHPVGAGAVTEYDRLFTCGYQAIVRCLVASANDWDNIRQGADKPVAGVRPSDTMLVEALQDLTESQLHRWLTHSHTLRLGVVERLAGEADWQRFVAFVDRYGGDLFTQKFLNLANLRAILFQRTAVWLSNLEQQDDPNADELRLINELDKDISRDDAAKWLTFAIEAVVENYREYRDYNTTTTHSDHGELLHTLIDFLRLRAAYDRVAWNLKPVVMAHEILVRHDRPVAAELWQQALADRTSEVADAHLAQFEQLCERYGVRLASIAERLTERFTRPLAIDRVRALVAPAMDSARSTDQTAFAALEQEIESLAHEPAGAGLDLPDWLAALEEEVSLVRCAKRHREPSDDVLRRIPQVRLSWEELQQQLADDNVGDAE
jgi:hypothetical protein